MSLLSIRNLHASIGEREILKGVNLEINQGEVHAIMGANGAGKSTLINSLFGEKMAREGIGKSCTTIEQKYTSKNYPFLNLYDTVGAEIGKGHTLETVQKETLDLITKNLNNKDPNDHIH